jgi:hypothetical protein
MLRGHNRGAAASCRPIQPHIKPRGLLVSESAKRPATCHTAVANLQSSTSARIARCSARASRFLFRCAKALPANSIAFSDRLPNPVWLQIQSRGTSATIFLLSRISLQQSAGALAPPPLVLPLLLRRLMRVGPTENGLLRDVSDVVAAMSPGSRAKSLRAKPANAESRARPCGGSSRLGAQPHPHHRRAWP